MLWCFQIRLESRGGPQTSLWLCTNGVLLRKLVGMRRAQETQGAGAEVEGEGGADKEGGSALPALDATHIIMVRCGDSSLR